MDFNKEQITRNNDRVEATVDALREAISSLKQQINRAYGTFTVECPFCQHPREIATINYRQHYEYIRPSSCYDGDYWQMSYAELVCTCCNKSFFPDRDQREKLHNLAVRGCFKSVTDVKDR